MSPQAVHCLLISHLRVRVSPFPTHPSFIFRRVFQRLSLSRSLNRGRLTRCRSTPMSIHPDVDPPRCRFTDPPRCRSTRTTLATRAQGPHPFPSRTRSLSPAAPMVLRPRGRGRVGRRRHPFDPPSRFTLPGGSLHLPPTLPPILTTFPPM